MVWALLAAASCGLAHAGVLPTVTLVFGDTSADEAGQDSAEFTVTRSGDTGSLLNVYLELGGSAVRTQDYSTSSGLFGAGGNTFFVQIPTAQSSRTITLTPTRDNISEGVETITATLLDPQDPGHQYTVGSPSSGQASIADDVAEVTMVFDDGMADEAGQDPASFTVTRTDQGNTGTTLNVYLELDGSAIRNQDYTNSSGMFGAGGNTYFVQIPSGQLSRTITLTPVRDNLIEGEETIAVTLIGPAAAGHDYTLGGDIMDQATIADDVAEVSMVFDDGLADEAGQDPASFTVTRSDQGNTGTTLNVYLELGGSAVRSQDYNSSSGMFSAGGNTYFVQIPSAQLSRTITLTPIRDNLIEGEETMTVTLIGPAAAGHDYTLGGDIMDQATIADAVAEVSVTVDDGQGAELGPDTAAMTFHRTDLGNTGTTLNVYLELGGSAIRNQDYNTSSGLFSAGGNTYFVQISTGQLSRTITFTPILDANETEGDENITVTLIGPQVANHDYLIGTPSSAEAIILDFIQNIFLDGFEAIPNP